MSRSKKTGDTLPIDLVACRRLLGALVMQLKQYEGEVSAYRMMIAVLRQSRPDIPWDKMLEKNRSSRRLKQQLHRKYDAPLGQLLEKIGQQLSEQEVQLWLEEWKPMGPKY